MTTIYLIRHGEAEGNLYRRMHGQLDSNITPLGRRQIAALALRFQDIPVEACYASDLRRTQTTAQAVYRPKGLELRLEPRFREICLGVWEETPFGYLYTFEESAINCFNRDPVHWQVEGAEPYPVYTDRFLAALEEVAKRHDGQHVAVVTHGSVMRGAMMRLFPGEKIPHCDNTAVTCLKYQEGRFALEYLNDNRHLDENLSTLARQRWWRATGQAKDVNLWFRPGFTAVPGLAAPQSQYVFTAMSEHSPVGILALDEEDDITGRITYLGLDETYRRLGLAVQLFGQAVFAFRALGKERLVLEVPAGFTGLDALVRQLELTAEGAGRFSADIRYQIPLVSLDTM